MPMQSIVLDGFWLIGALLATYLTGVFSSQWAKDKLTGFPAELRAGLKTQETAALSALKAAQAKVIADVAGLLTKATVKPVAPAAAPAPVAAAVAVEAAKPAV